MPSLQSYFFRNYLKVFQAITSRLSFRTFRKLAASGDRFNLLARGVHMERVNADGIKCEWLIPAKPVSETIILYLHGGGWIMGWSFAHRYPISQLVRASGMRTLAVDYRLAPEQPFPVPLNDCITAYHWLVQGGVAPQNIILAGDSAGGNMVITLMLALKEAGESLPAAAISISPVIDFERRDEKASSNFVKDPVLTSDWHKQMLRSYLANNDPHNPLINPLYGDLKGLPPLLIQVGERERLLQDAKRLAEHAQAAGVEVEIEVWDQMWHVWHVLAPLLPEANQAFQKIAAFINRLPS